MTHYSRWMIVLSWLIAIAGCGHSPTAMENRLVHLSREVAKSYETSDEMAITDAYKKAQEEAETRYLGNQITISATVESVDFDGKIQFKPPSPDFIYIIQKDKLSQTGASKNLNVSDLPKPDVFAGDVLRIQGSVAKISLYKKNGRACVFLEHCKVVAQ